MARGYDLLLLLLVATIVYRRVTLGADLSLEGPVAMFQGALVIALTAVHAVLRSGVRRAAVLALATVAIAFPAEWLGATRGWIFGSYDYTGLFAYRVGGIVPLFVPAAWCMLVYVGDALAEMAVPEDAPRAARVVYASLCVLSWDLLFDPVCVVAGGWSWEGGGAYFGGVPLSNFGGWLGVALAIYTLNEVLTSRWPPRPPMWRRDPWRASTPLVLYVAFIALLAVFAARNGLPGAAICWCIAALPQALLAGAGYAAGLGGSPRTSAPPTRAVASTA